MLQSRLIGGLTVLALLTASVRAEEPAPPQTFAVLIGVSNFKDKEIKARPHAEDDAKALFDLLTDKQYLGIDKDHIKLLLGTEDAKRGSQLATHKNVLEAVEWLAKEAKKNDTVIFAFIGEGGPVGEKSERRCYFVQDSTLKERNKTAVAAEEFNERFNKLQSQNVCFLVDVNFKGNAGSIADPPVDHSYQEFLGTVEGEEEANRPGRVLLLATSGASTSLDLEKNGLFTHVVLAGLKGAADKDGGEADGHVTVVELATYVMKELPDLARKFGKTREEKRQLALVDGDRNSQFTLTKNPAAAEEVQKRLDKFAELVKDKKIDDTIAEEGKKLLERMPALESERKLRKQYQKLADGTLDVADFQKQRTEIIDARKLDRKVATEFARLVLDGANKLQKQYVKKVEKGELIAHAIKGLFQQTREKPPADLAQRLNKAKSLKEGELVGLLIDSRLALGKREDLDKSRDVNIAMERMLGHLDPHTRFIRPEDEKNFNKDIEGKFVGIGITVRKEQEGILVVSPIKDSPAYKAGLYAGDLITDITRLVDDDGKKLPKPEVISARNLSINDAVAKISGIEGTPIKLTVQREGAEKPLQVEVNRGSVEVETVFGVKRKADDSWDFMLDPEKKIGYIRLNQFNSNSADDIKKAVKQLKKADMKGLVFDLRFNPGGDLEAACKIADLFIDDGLIVTIKYREGPEERLGGQSEGSELGFPMVCLVNGSSASASEVLAGCFQDHKRALIVGERSYGKGSVQTIEKFEGGGKIKVTIATFYRPNGKNINRTRESKEGDDWGVRPDINIKLSLKELGDLSEYQEATEVIPRKDKPNAKPLPSFKDKQLNAGLEYLSDQIKLAAKVPDKKP